MKMMGEDSIRDIVCISWVNGHISALVFRDDILQHFQHLHLPILRTPTFLNRRPSNSLPLLCRQVKGLLDRTIII